MLIIAVFIVNNGNNKNKSKPIESVQTSDVAVENSEENAWREAKLLNTIEGYKAYRQNYNGGLYSDDALARINEIEDNNDWQTASTINTKEAYEEYRHNHPNGKNINNVQKKIDEIAEKNDWQTILALNTKRAFMGYLEAHPTGAHATEARQKIADLDNLALQEKKRQQTAEAAKVAARTNARTESNVLNAKSVIYVEYLVGDSRGIFYQRGPQKWVEKNSEGVFTFNEKSRDDWSIYLFDPGRQVSIQLDLHRKQILYEGSLLYNISNYSDKIK